MKVCYQRQGTGVHAVSTLSRWGLGGRGHPRVSPPSHVARRVPSPRRSPEARSNGRGMCSGRRRGVVVALLIHYLPGGLLSGLLRCSEVINYSAVRLVADACLEGVPPDRIVVIASL